VRDEIYVDYTERTIWLKYKNRYRFVNYFFESSK